MDTGRDNLKKTGVTDDVITRNKNEYSSHAISEVMDVKTGISESLLQDPGLVSNEFINIYKLKRIIKDNN